MREARVLKPGEDDHHYCCARPVAVDYSVRFVVPITFHAIYGLLYHSKKSQTFGILGTVSLPADIT